MPSKKSVIRPVVLAVSALFVAGVYAQNVDTKDQQGDPKNLGYYDLTVRSGTSSSMLDHLTLLIEDNSNFNQTVRSTLNAQGLLTGGVEARNLTITGKADFTGAEITGLTGQFDPTKAGALAGVTTLRGSSTDIIDLTGTSTSKLGKVHIDELNSTKATVQGNLTVTKASNTAGITNTGDISTETITTTASATVGGLLHVSGKSTTRGINNEGDFDHLGRFKANNTQSVDGVSSGVGIDMYDPSQIVMGASFNQELHSAIRFGVTGPAQLLGDFVVTSVDSAGFPGSKDGGNLKVMGKTTLEGATTVNNTLDVTGVTTLNGATTVNNTLNVNGATTIVGSTSVTGATTIVGATNINTTGNAATTIGNAAAAATLVGNVVSAAGGDLGNSGLTLKKGEASLTVKNAQGNTHGLVVGESSTTLSGGTSSTNLTLNDSGATFSNAATGAPTRVTGVANGSSDFDAVNVRQFSAAVAGVAASANIPGLDTNKTTSVGVGLGSYMSSQALAFGGSYRFSDKGVLRASLATGLNTGGSKTTFGIGAGWSW